MWCSSNEALLVTLCGKGSMVASESNEARLGLGKWVVVRCHGEGSLEIDRVIAPEKGIL